MQVGDTESVRCEVKLVRVSATCKEIWPPKTLSADCLSDCENSANFKECLLVPLGSRLTPLVLTPVLSYLLSDEQAAVFKGSS